VYQLLLSDRQEIISSIRFIKSLEDPEDLGEVSTWYESFFRSSF
jgi:hypothetical protein